MPDMLARLYNLPVAAPYIERATAAGFTIRRADPWDLPRMREFVAGNFGERWSAEAELAFAHTPITAYLAVKDNRDCRLRRLRSYPAWLLRTNRRP